jgi:hypothetical protein
MAPEQARGAEVDARTCFRSAPFSTRWLPDGRHLAAQQQPSFWMPFEPATPAYPRAQSTDTGGTRPRYGEGLAGRIARCGTRQPPLKADLKLAENQPNRSGASRSRRSTYAAGAALAVVIAAAVYAICRQPRAAPQWTQLTAFEQAAHPALSPNGRMLAFPSGAGSIL